MFRLHRCFARGFSKAARNPSATSRGRTAAKQQQQTQSQNTTTQGQKKEIDFTIHKFNDTQQEVEALYTGKNFMLYIIGGTVSMLAGAAVIHEIFEPDMSIPELPDNYERADYNEILAAHEQRVREGKL